MPLTNLTGYSENRTTKNTGYCMKPREIVNVRSGGASRDGMHLTYQIDIILQTVSCKVFETKLNERFIKKKNYKTNHLNDVLDCGGRV